MYPKIVVANWVHAEVLNCLRPHGMVVANTTFEPWSRIELIDRCQGAEALIAFMPEMIDDEFLAACSGLRIIACALKGYDNFDVNACSRRRIWLTIVPDLLTAPTAELSIAMMIALGRNILRGDTFVGTGKFSGWRPRFYGHSLDGSVVGIIGAGAVGKAIAQRLSGFECRVLYHDNHKLDPNEEETFHTRYVPLLELQKHSEFVVLALPLTNKTIHLVNATFLSQMKPGSYLINPARGSLVDEAAVADALEDGHLAGYAADTFECEDWARPNRPGAVETRLRKAKNTVLTPHLGSAVDSVRREIALEAAESVVLCLQGMQPKGAVNGPFLSPTDRAGRDRL